MSSVRTKSQKRTGPAAARKRRPAARGARWKLPALTPIGADAPVSKTLPLAIKRIAKALDPEKIILFGSYAYGQPTPDSDVDLLVVLNNQASHRDNYLAVSNCLLPRPFAVDIVVRTPHELQTALANGDFFMQEITQRGKTLYERSV